MPDIAALYVDPKGPYPALGLDCWDKARDARRYSGPWAVIAHPPCGPWGKLSHFSKQDASLAPIAVAQVRAWGGVLEHPEHSRLWLHCRLPKPGEFPDDYGGFTVAVDQCAYGHCTRKRTWLYVVRGNVPPLLTGGVPTHAICNGRSQLLGNAVSDVHVRHMLARLELLGSKMMLLGDEGPRSCPTKFWWAAGACRYCGGPINAGCGGKCAVRAIEQRTTADDPDPGDPPQEES